MSRGIWPAWPLRTALSAVLVAAAMGLGACRPPEAPGNVSAEAALPPGHHRLTGEIVKVDAEHKRLLVMHEEIPGYMPAMTMEFRASDGDLAILREGQRIRAVMVEQGDGEFALEQIWPGDPVADATVEAAAKALRQDTTIRGRSAYREVGEAAPDFALYDQEGRVAAASRFRGKQVMLNFIYTRCPVATMCPASTMRMMQTQQAAREAGVTDLELISITLDPAYDTPGVLKEYAEVRGIDTGNFSFLTGPEGAIRDLLAQFGVVQGEFDGPLLKHSLATLLIDPSGRIVWRVDGSSWEAQDFVDRMRKGAPASAAARATPAAPATPAAEAAQP